MKKFLISTILLVALLTGCSESSNDSFKESAEVIEDNAEMSSEPQISDTKFPEPVTSIYKQYKNVFAENNSDFSLSDVSEENVGESRFFDFEIKHINYNSTCPTVTFQNNKESFKVTLPDNIENADLKEIIRYTIISTQNGNSDDADSCVQKLSNSFDGSKRSETVRIGKYSYYLSPSESISTRCLNVISDTDLNKKIDVTKYIEGTPDFFLGELNMDEPVYIRGTIKNISTELGVSCAMEVVSDENTYIVYFNYDQFLGLLNSGDSHTFYGKVAKFWEGYSGTMRLEYLE